MEELSKKGKLERLLHNLVESRRLTSLQKGLTLRVDLESFDGKTAWAEYSDFR
jgi:hypothetical protein